MTPVLADDKLSALPPAVREVTIQAGDLRLLLRDNSESPKRALSGIDALFNLRSAPQFDAFDPDTRGASAGMNFEHIISGHKHEHNAFSPRSGAYALHHEPGSMSATLVRKWEDEPWKVSSRFTYRLVAPHFIDFDFRCTVDDPALFDPEKYAVFFFANYMHDVERVGLNFRGINSPVGNEEWIYADAPAGPKDWNQGGTYRHREGTELRMATDQNFRLNTWSYDFPRYTQPFYFGKAAHGMTLILMFDKTATSEEEIRFSLFKFKLQKHPRPAWDFQYVRKKLEAGKEYGFRGRLVWKKFVSPEDCLREYQTWSAGLPRRP
ncbi:MAG: hypothetical protein U0903_01565 [Planctomycetales bacterium]